MGRHAAPELDCPTEVIAVQVAPRTRYVAEGRTDFAKWWRNADTKARCRFGALLALPVVGATILFASNPGAPLHSSTTDPSWDARMQGVSYAADLRDQGYNSASVEANCGVDAGGYNGSYWDDYRNGCVGVALQMMDQGR